MLRQAAGTGQERACLLCTTAGSARAGVDTPEVVHDACQEGGGKALCAANHALSLFADAA